MFVSNKPKMPTIFRIRDDITWDDVVRNWNEQDASLKTRSPTGTTSIPIIIGYFCLTKLQHGLSRQISTILLGIGPKLPISENFYWPLLKTWDSIPG